MIADYFIHPTEPGEYVWIAYEWKQLKRTPWWNGNGWRYRFTDGSWMATSGIPFEVLRVPDSGKPE